MILGVCCDFRSSTWFCATAVITDGIWIKLVSLNVNLQKMSQHSCCFLGLDQFITQYESRRLNFLLSDKHYLFLWQYDPIYMKWLIWCNFILVLLLCNFMVHPNSDIQANGIERRAWPWFSQFFHKSAIILCTFLPRFSCSHSYNHLQHCWYCSQLTGKIGLFVEWQCCGSWQQWWLMRAGVWCSMLQNFGQTCRLCTERTWPDRKHHVMWAWYHHSILSVLAKRLAGKSIFDMTYLVSSGI